MGISEEIKQLDSLRSAGVITQEDFYLKKAQILKSSASVGDLAGLKELLDAGVITQEEFFMKKTEALNQPSQAGAQMQTGAGNGVAAGEKTKIAAGLLAIFLGSFGAHKFYLGYQKEAIIMLCITIAGVFLAFFIIGIFACLAMEVIAIIEGIIYLTKTDEQFQEMYVVNKKAWF